MRTYNTNLIMLIGVVLMALFAGKALYMLADLIGLPV